MIPDDTKYNQSHATIYEQDEAVGHSVRAVYMYTAMADTLRRRITMRSCLQRADGSGRI